jgi:glyoxylase-like metal-dependent hydrolase (beta-lactamase superfamily II)
VIDPARELDPLLTQLQEARLSLQGIILTHSHHDHISGVPRLLELHPDLPIHMHPLDAHRLPDELRTRIIPAHDHARIPIAPNGDLALQVIHAPGHSAGELCFQLQTPDECYLFTGDTLFIRDCGRTDLPTGDDTQMYATLQRLKQLSPDLIVLPGHHYTPECASRLGTELQISPPLLAGSVEELARL